MNLLSFFRRYNHKNKNKGKLSEFAQWDFDVVFFCSSHVDEVWIRSTARKAAEVGLRCCIAITDDATSLALEEATYTHAGIDFRDTLDFTQAAEIKTKIMVTASSGINRSILPTKAQFLIHMPHSLVSLHMIYPHDAFNGYDVLFSCGPHHDAEYAEICKRAKLVDRRVYQVGYGKLDVLFEALKRQQRRKTDWPPPFHVLVAPSWGPRNLLEEVGPELVAMLLSRGWHVTVRPHPLLIIEESAVLSELNSMQACYPDLSLELDLVSNEAILDADLLIADYSGTAFEFCALHHKQAIFVDVDKKVLNPDWQAFDIMPVEVSLRGQLGQVCDLDTHSIVGIAEALSTSSRDTSAAISSFLHQPPGACADTAVEAILKLLRECDK